MEFYLNNQPIDVVDGIVINETIDEVLNKMSLTLALKDQKDAIKPLTPFKLVDTNETLYFVVESDDVELESKSPLIYRHQLNLIEETELLKHYQIRNTICTQPSRKKTTKTKVYGGIQGVLTSTSKSIEIKSYEKIKSIMLEVRATHINYTHSSPKPAVGNITDYFDVIQAENVPCQIVVKDNQTIIFNETRNFSKQEFIKLPIGDYSNLTIEMTLKTESGLYSVFAKMYVETYYYTLLDVVNLINERLYQHYQFKYVLNNELGLLNEIIAPNFSFTENSVYDALDEVFSFIDGRPTLANNEIGIKFFNERNNKVITNEELSGYKSSLSNNKFANGLISKFQNAGTEEPIVYPSNFDFCKPQPTTIGVPTETSWGIILDKKIRYIERIEVSGDITFALENSTTKNGTYYLKDFTLDLTDYLFEETNYLQLPKLATINFDELTKKALQNNSYHYKSGDNVINYFNVSKTILGTQIYGVGFTLLRAFYEEVFGGFVGLKNYSWQGITIDDKNLKYRIVYYPIVEGKILIEQQEEKHNGEIRLSQSNGGTSINRMGQNLFGQLIRMGNEERVAVPKITKFNERYKVGNTYETDWLVNKATTTIFKDFATQTLQLTKNYNLMSKFTKLNQVKRFNEIDSSVVGKSEEIYRQYLYFDTKIFNTHNDVLDMDEQTITDSFVATFNGDVNYKTDLSIAKFKSDAINYIVRIPMMKYGCGNAFCFEFSFDNAISSGQQLVQDEAFYGEKYFSRYCLYADENGRFDRYEIQVGCPYLKATPTIQGGVTFDSLPYLGTTFDNSDSVVGTQQNWSCALRITEPFNKQPNEIFSVNYELICFSKNKNLLIGNAFITNNALVDNCKPLKCYLWYSEEYYSIMDTLPMGRKARQVTCTYDNQLGAFNFGKFHSSARGKAWCIANEKNEILIACNEEIKPTTDILLYMKTSKIRL